MLRNAVRLKRESASSNIAEISYRNLWLSNTNKTVLKEKSEGSERLLMILLCRKVFSLRTQP